MIIKVALLIVFNHRYDKNFNKLEELYKGKFQNIFFIVPFYDGDKENVITVFESSYYFEGYIAQAYQKIKTMGFTHFYFVADDMILNPSITEENMFSKVGISYNDCWIYDFRDFKNTKLHHRVPLYTPIEKSGIEVIDMMPSLDIIKSKFDANGIAYFPSKWYALKKFFKYLRPHRHCPKALYDSLCYILGIELVDLRKIKKFYPAVWGYSDILIVTSECMENFAQYCGFFSGLKVFVENAIPLALLMASDNIKTGKDIKLKAIPQLSAMDDDFQKKFYLKYNYSLHKLISEYPNDLFFIHPLKLSRWT